MWRKYSPLGYKMPSLWENKMNFFLVKPKIARKKRQSKLMEFRGYELD